MHAETLLLRYGYPCVEERVEKGELKKELLKKVEQAIRNDQPLKKEEIRKMLPRAVQGVDQIVKHKKKTEWTPELVREYFFTTHNENVNEICKAQKATVMDEEDEFYEVKTEQNEIKKVFSTLLQKCKRNDKIVIHRCYAIEILSQQDI